MEVCGALGTRNCGNWRVFVGVPFSSSAKQGSRRITYRKCDVFMAVVQL